MAPLIAGAGPAGCAAALALLQTGHKPMLIDRQKETGDALCGGFLSWRTLATLTRLGLDTDALQGHRVDRLRLFAGDMQSESRLPAPAIGVSRHRLDTQMQTRALALGAKIAWGVRLERIDADGQAHFSNGLHPADTLFVAAGKHDVPGLARLRPDTGLASVVGLRCRIPAHPAVCALIAGAIELHLFEGGYAGLVMQEDGSANLCMAVRKGRLAEAGGSPDALLAALAADNPHLAARLAHGSGAGRFDAIGAIPYGWRAKTTRPGLFLLGDQAACIPSLAGEGLSIAVASGVLAADYWRKGGETAAASYQRTFARRTARPVGMARLIWHASESKSGARWLVRLAGVPGLAALAARLTRISL